MPSKVYNNVVDHKLLDGKTTVEDITKVGLPEITHQSTEISAAGMVMTVDMPDTTRLEAMEYSIAHNNGANCNVLSTPGKHTHEFRIARQKYTVAKGEIGYESVKYRMIGVHKKSSKGDIEAGNPYGTTETYSCLRYEEEIDGKIVTVIDAMAGVIKYNGKSYTDTVQNLLK